MKRIIIVDIKTQSYRNYNNMGQRLNTQINKEYRKKAHIW